MSRTRFTLPFDLHNMVPGPAASTTVQVVYKNEDGILLCYGTSAVSVLQAEAADTYAPGCIYIRTVSGGDSVSYVNQGAAGAVANFDVVLIESADIVTQAMIEDDAIDSARLDESVIQTVSKTYTATQIRAMGTAVELVAAPGSGKAIEFIDAYLFLDYSGGALSAQAGNIRIGSMNQGAWASSFISATGDRVVMSHCGPENDSYTYFINTALTLKFAANPTGAGSTSVLKVRVAYRVHDFN